MVVTKALIWLLYPIPPSGGLSQVSIQPYTIEGLYKYGYYYYKNENYELAKSYFNSAKRQLKLASTSDEYRFIGNSSTFLGVIKEVEEYKKVRIAHTAKEDYEFALNCYTKAIAKAKELGGDEDDAIYDIGVCCYRYGKILREEKSEADFKQQTSEPEDHCNKFIQAEKWIMEAISISENKGKLNWEYYFMMGLVLSDGKDDTPNATIQQQQQQAISYYDQAISINPTDYRPWYNKGLALHNLHRYEEANDCYNNAIRHAIDKCPQWVIAFIWNDYGNSLYNLGKEKEAKSCHEKALSLANVQSPYIINNLSWSLIKLGEIEDADKQIDKVLNRFKAKPNLNDDVFRTIAQYPITIKRTLKQALFIKGYILMEQKLYNKASTYIDAAIELGNRFDVTLDALPYYYKGNMSYEQKDYEAAIENYRQAIHINRELAEAHDSLGVAISKKADDENALKEASKEIGTAIEIKPNLFPAHQHLIILQAAMSSGKTFSGTGPRFIRFWSSSWKRALIAVALVTTAVGLAYFDMHFNDRAVSVQNTTSSQLARLLPNKDVLKINNTVVNNVSEQSRTETYGLIIVGLILLILLLPDIQRARIGPVQLDITSYGPGDHGTLEDLTNKITQPLERRSAFENKLANPSWGQ
jgi:tetratricopeptide (TPR) repeat protein